MDNNLMLKKEVDRLLSDIDLVDIDTPLPDIENITEHSMELFYRLGLDPKFMQVLETIGIFGRNVPINTYKINIYTLGVILFEAKIVTEAITYFEWSASIDKGYHQAYNRLGDCYMSFFGAENVKPQILEMGLKCYRTALYYCDHGTICKEPYSIPIHNYKADNLLKMGLYFKNVGRNMNARTFISYAEELSDNFYVGYRLFNYESWNHLLHTIPDKD